MCKVLGVTESGYYKSIRNRGKLSKCEQRHSEVLKNIYELLREDEENANYGMKRIYLGLKTRFGYTGSYYTVTRICHDNGLVIKQKRRPKSITKADEAAQKSENLIQQDFTAEKPNEKWLTDCIWRRISTATPEILSDFTWTQTVRLSYAAKPSKTPARRRERTA